MNLHQKISILHTWRAHNISLLYNYTFCVNLCILRGHENHFMFHTVCIKQTIYSVQHIRDSMVPYLLVMEEIFLK